MSAASVAYLGSSVTAQSKGFRPLLHRELCRATGRALRPVHAGIGGVGSISGLFLLDALVLAHRPALCFIEFATTDIDGATPAPLLPDVLAALVHRLRAHGCEPCFVLLDRADSLPARESTLAAYRAAAAEHEVTCADLSAELRGDPAAFRDHVHTSALGSQLIAGAVAAAVTERDLLGRGAGPAGQPPRLADARIVAAAPAMVDGGVASTGRLGDVFDYVGAAAGAHLRPRLDGDLYGLALAVGPRSGALAIESGGEREEHLVWDPWCWYDRLSTVICERPRRAADGVSVESLPAVVDAAACHRPVDPAARGEQELRVIGFMVAG
jgi:hypothetical protein